jgi:hypothetical protein
VPPGREKICQSNCKIEGWSEFWAVHNVKHKGYGIKMYKSFGGNGYKSDMVTYLIELLLNSASDITPTHGIVQQQTKWKMLHKNYSWIIILY